MGGGGGSGRDGGEDGREHALADQRGVVFRVVVGIDGEVTGGELREEFGAGRDDGLDALAELHDADLRRLVDGDRGNAEDVGEAGQAVCLVVVVERVEDLDCTTTRG